MGQVHEERDGTSVCMSNVLAEKGTPLLVRLVPAGNMQDGVDCMVVVIAGFEHLYAYKERIEYDTGLEETCVYQYDKEHHFLYQELRV